MTSSENSSGILPATRNLSFLHVVTRIDDTRKAQVTMIHERLIVDFLARINRILGAPGTNSAELVDALARTETLYHECVELR
jgi:hypothetical protein